MRSDYWLLEKGEIAFIRFLSCHEINHHINAETIQSDGETYTHITTEYTTNCIMPIKFMLWNYLGGKIEFKISSV
jgi:hypothetical protein